MILEWWDEREATKACAKIAHPDGYGVWFENGHKGYSAAAGFGQCLIDTYREVQEIVAFVHDDRGIRAFVGRSLHVHAAPTATFDLTEIWTAEFSSPGYRKAKSVTAVCNWSGRSCCPDSGRPLPAVWAVRARWAASSRRSRGVSCRCAVIASAIEGPCREATEACRGRRAVIVHPACLRRCVAGGSPVTTPL